MEVQTEIKQATTYRSFVVDWNEVVLENFGLGKGQITIYSPSIEKYHMYWGSMGSSIEEFIYDINQHYFADKLLGSRKTEVFDVKKTFAQVRKYIREELDLPWYKYQEFQKSLRECLNQFQEHCESINSDVFFVDRFSFYLGTMPSFHLIEDRWECERIESDLKNLSEPWHFICTKESYETKLLKSLHSKIKKQIKKNNWV